MRSEQRLRSPNIYGDGAVIRDVLSLRGRVRPGNSGGPVVSSAGDVVGVVFAASLTDSETGYALTAEQVAQAATRGVAATERRRHPGLRGIGVRWSRRAVEARHETRDRYASPHRVSRLGASAPSSTSGDASRRSVRAALMFCASAMAFSGPRTLRTLR